MTTATTVNTPGTPMSNAEALRLRQHIGKVPCVAKDAVWPALPVGWLPIAFELAKQLQGLRQGHPNLAELAIRRLYVRDGIELAIDVNDYETIHVQGVIRKFRTRSRHTCSRCGTPGRQRQFGRHDKRILCAPCAAPLLLHNEVQRFDAILDQYFGYAALPLRRVPAGLRQSLKHWVTRQDGQPPESGDEIPIWHVAEWRTALRPVVERLNKQIKRQKNGESDD